MSRRASATYTRAATRKEQRPFESWEEVEAIAAEMPPAFAAIPLVLVGTGLRPEELFALERRDVDLEAGVLSVERVYSQRVLKEPKKSSRQRRRVPLRARVVEALRAVPPRLDTPLLFAGTRGGHIDDNKVLARETLHVGKLQARKRMVEPKSPMPAPNDDDRPVTAMPGHAARSHTRGVASRRGDRRRARAPLHARA